MIAVNEKGSSPASDPVAIKAAIVPDAPENGAKDTASTSQITIVWDAPGSDGYASITNYEVAIDDG